MRPIFEYLEYRDILKDAYEDRKSVMPLYSYRMMGLRLGLDSSYVFRVIQQEQHLPARCMPQAVEFLGLTGRSAEYFQLLVAYQRERKTSARQKILEKAMSLRDVVCNRLKGQELAFFRDWWIVAVHCLLEMVEGRPNPKEIANRLRPKVSEQQVQDALDLLLELGLVKKGPSGTLLLAHTHLTVRGDEKTKAVRAFQRQVLTMAQESFERFPREARDISTLTVSVDDAATVDIREMLRESRRQIQKRVEEAKHPDRVMQIAMAYFPLAPALDD